ncbi:response regulator [Pseudoduganella namucuonensis]|uniref:Response regulator receiver domain-containing protein n=1 Tax=Pseudoduganella namucuonensis TaxID=1035707 RepID=A0A1I7KNV9_9BURK|nr:response regulator [Pseudoduganella namucuonensis]SFU99090.1 Response regulator receiver domain-containing protein [Pseudoduganella namucuonensis]
MNNSSKPILLVEDDSVDVMTIRRALKEIRVGNPVVVMEHGEAALDHLRDPANERPCIILLDLNMPVMNGIEFLREAKADPALRRIPVVVLTTSEEQQDKVNSFDSGVAGYMAKPVDYRRFVEVVRSIDLYWTISEMP